MLLEMNDETYRLINQNDDFDPIKYAKIYKSLINFMVDNTKGFAQHFWRNIKYLRSPLSSRVNEPDYKKQLHDKITEALAKGQVYMDV